MININQKTKRYRKLETRKFEYNLKFEIDELTNKVKVL